METATTLTEEEKKAGRLLILEDALKQLEGGIFKAADGYLAMTRLSPTLEAGRYQLQQLLKEGQVLCYGCALGAIFLGYVKRYNKYAVDVFSDGCCDTQDLYRKTLVSYLDRYFDHTELYMIEAAYEGWGDSEIEPLYVSAWAHQYPHKRERLTEILKNCLRNDGIFNPRDGILERTVEMLEDGEYEDEDDYEEICDDCGEDLDDCCCDEDDEDDYEDD